MHVPCDVSEVGLGFDPNSSDTTETLCTIAKPFVWHRDEALVLRWEQQFSLPR